MNSLLEFSATYTYSVGVIILFLFWCPIFLKKRINKDEMLLAGLVFGVASVLIGIKYSLHDYWHPAYVLHGVLIEDFLYGFFFGGICSQVYFFFFNVKERLTNKHHPFFIGVSIFSSIMSFIFLTGILKLNSIIANIAPPLLIGLYICYKNPKDLKVQIWSGFFATVIIFIIFQILLLVNPNFIQQTWYLNNITGILVLGVPLEEYLFAFSLGFGLSMLYEFVTGRELMIKK